MSEFVLGTDLSMNHGAFVTLDGAGEMADYRYVTDRVKVATKSRLHGEYFNAGKIRDMHARGVVRTVFWDVYLNRLFAGALTHVGIEDYAYDQVMGAHQMGEVGGLFRLKAYMRGVCLRIHDPGSIKMFAAHDGSADKREVAHFVKERWTEAQEFERYSYDRPKGAFTEIEEDLCDAFAVAKLVWTEIQLRAGKMKMSDLHPKEVQVFNRTTKQYPVNILGREWLQRRRG